MKRLTTTNIEDLVPYPPGKPIEELERELGITGSIKLASNENPLGPSPKAVSAIIEKTRDIHRYPDGSGYYLKSKLSSKFDIPRDQIVIGNGSNELIELILRTFMVPGDEVIQPYPTFLVYEKFVTAGGGRMVSVPLQDFQVDLDAVMRAVTPRTKIIFINNPNNPTGTAVMKDPLSVFLTSLPQDIVVVLDEAYIEFVQDPNIQSGLKVRADHPRLMVLRTFSKLYGLAGLRIGYGFASEEIIDFLNRVRQPFNANMLAQAAATAALDDHEFVIQTLKVVKEGLDYLYRASAALGLTYVPTHTNFVLIKVPMGGKKLYDMMLKEGVIVRAMDSFGMKDYIRINVGRMEENERFIETLKKIQYG